MIINEDFVFNLIIINKVLTKSLKFSEFSNLKKDIEVILSSMIQIIRELKVNNYVKKFAFEFSKFSEKLIDDNNLLTVNELFIVKVKDRFKKTKNKKKVMTRAEKAKIKFIKWNSLNFKYIKINFRCDDCDDRCDYDNHDK